MANPTHTKGGAQDTAIGKGPDHRPQPDTTMGKAADKAQDVMGKVADRAQDMASKVGDRAQDVANRARDMAQNAGQKAEDLTHKAGSAIESLGQTIRERAPHEGTLGQVAGKAADNLSSAGHYLQEEGLQGMAEDLTDLVRRNPIPALLIGIGIGFLIARATSSRS